IKALSGIETKGAMLLSSENALSRRKHRKHFACGHRGFGQFCHRCADEEKKRQAVITIKQALNQGKQLLRQQWIQISPMTVRFSGS
ncbi:MAG: hypothetical protein AAF327_17680, partial [Cyanobacteria bacterium P01_A01_bin.37]